MNSTVKKVQFSDKIDVCYFKSGLPYAQLLAMRDKTARKFGYISEEDAQNMQDRKILKNMTMQSCDLVEEVYHELLKSCNVLQLPGYGTDCSDDFDDEDCSGDSDDE